MDAHVSYFFVGKAHSLNFQTSAKASANMMWHISLYFNKGKNRGDEKCNFQYANWFRVSLYVRANTPEEKKCDECREQFYN